MITYDEAKIEQERNDPKWISSNGTVCKVNQYLYIDIVELRGDLIECVQAFGVGWHLVDKYRLHNGVGYKDGIAIDELKGCKITQRKEQEPSTRDKLIAMLDDNEAWERIALEACLEQQKVIDKAKVIKAAYNIIFDNSGASSAQLARHLYAAGCLTLPEGDNND